MKTYKNYRTALRNLGYSPSPVHCDGEIHWTGEQVEIGGEIIAETAFAMLLGGQVADRKHDRIFQVVSLNCDYFTRTIGVAGGVVVDIFGSREAAVAAYEAYLEKYSTSREWVAHGASVE